MRKPIFFLFGTTLCLFSCNKEVELSPVPEISVVSVTPLSPVEYQDSITIVISYSDGDGDLGENDPNVQNLFVKDSRLSTEYAFRIQQLAPTGSSIPIQGNLNVKIPPTGITNGASSQSASFSIRVVDRAGNASNTVTTESINIIQ